jgi:hypothetical protein
LLALPGAGPLPAPDGQQHHGLLEQILEELPFAVQRIQTNRGQEFFAYQVQEQRKRPPTPTLTC